MPLTASELLELHPWPAEWAAEKRLEWYWTIHVPGDPEALWRVMSDTSRFNRAIGASEMKFVETPDGVRRGSSRNGGVKHEWTEVPWNWVAGQWLDSVRIYDRGFSRVIYAVQRLEPHDGGTMVHVYFGAVPRGAIGSAALRIGFPSIERGYRKVLPQLAAQLDRARPDVLQLPPPELSPDQRSRLDAIEKQLVERGLDAPSVARLAEWVRSGDEQDLYRIQIRERARAWNLPEHDLLRAALNATRFGMLEMSWDVVCPHCRGVRDESPSLGGVPREASCAVCDISFGTGDPESVEITFHIHPSVREVPKRLFCSAEPATKDHIRVQRVIAAGASAEVRPALTPGRYRMRLAGDRAYRYLDVADGVADATLTWTAGDATIDTPAIASGRRPAIVLANPGDAARCFVIEQASWKDDALRPGQLLSFQEFRDLFSEQYVDADVQLGVGEQTLLFTDMVGSTSFYASRGDPTAFVDVKRHFDEVFAIVAKHRGAVVKTIGDACMAAFVSPLDAVRASRHIHDTFPPDRADTPIRLRISLNTGPCIAVRLNSDIDYFGGTVNIAAKLQTMAEAWQIAMSYATYDSPGVADYIAEHTAAPEARSTGERGAPETRSTGERGAPETRSTGERGAPETRSTGERGAPETRSTGERGALDDLTYTSPALPGPVRVKRWTVYRATSVAVPSGAATG